ncbi:MAG: hypothetical protein MJ014_00420 [Methanocorpusculum sp.]|nr:hypothetical protein [Methanocorpusculum sp.]
MKVDMIFLKHMLERCEKVRKITASTTKEEFCYDPDKQDLVGSFIGKYRRGNNAFVTGVQRKICGYPLG